jgi:hypothetical protein
MTLLRFSSGPTVKPVQEAVRCIGNSRARGMQLSFHQRRIFA